MSEIVQCRSCCQLRGAPLQPPVQLVEAIFRRLHIRGQQRTVITRLLTLHQLDHPALLPIDQRVQTDLHVPRDRLDFLRVLLR